MTPQKQHRAAHEDRSGVPNPVLVQKFLSGLDYPVKRRELIDKAKAAGADRNVLEALLCIPDREYDSPVSVSKEVGNLE